MNNQKDYLSAFKDPKVIDALQKGGHISPETYKSMKKFASGGMVEGTEQAPENNPAPQMTQAEAEQAVQDMIRAPADPQPQYPATPVPSADATPAQASVLNSLASETQPDSSLAQKIDAAKQNTAAQANQSDGAPSPNQYQLQPVQKSPNQDFETNAFNSAYKNMNQGFAAQAKGANDAAQAAQAEGQQMGKYLQGVTDQMQQQADQQKSIEADRQSREQDQIDKLNQMNEDYLNKAAIDPNRYWNSKTTGQKIMAGIGIALGGLGSHGGNAALDVINNAINRDIDAQKADVEKAKSGVQMQQSVYKDMLDQFQDQRTAESAARLQMLSIAEQQVKTISAQYQGPKAQAAAEQAIGQLKAQQSQEQLKFMQSYRTSVGYQQADAQQRAILRLPTPELQKQAQDQLQDYQKVQKTKQMIDDAYETMAKTARSPVPSDIYAFNTAKATVQSKMKDVFEGRPSEFVNEILSNQLPGRLTPQSAIRNMHQKFSDQLAAEHSWPVLTGYNIIPKQLNLKRN